MVQASISPHVIASRALYAARMTAPGTPRDYEVEVYQQLDRFSSDLPSQMVDDARREIQERLPLICL